MGKTEESSVIEQATYSWFGVDGERVSIYPDGTVEVQEGERSFRAKPHSWVLAAETFNRTYGPTKHTPD